MSAENPNNMFTRELNARIELATYRGKNIYVTCFIDTAYIVPICVADTHRAIEFRRRKGILQFKSLQSGHWHKLIAESTIEER